MTQRCSVVVTRRREGFFFFFFSFSILKNKPFFSLRTRLPLLLFAFPDTVIRYWKVPQCTNGGAVLKGLGWRNVLAVLSVRAAWLHIVRHSHLRPTLEAQYWSSSRLPSIVAWVPISTITE